MLLVPSCERRTRAAVACAGSRLHTSLPYTPLPAHTCPHAVPLHLYTVPRAYTTASSSHHCAHTTHIHARAVYADGRVCISILHSPGDDPHGYEKASERWLPIHSVRAPFLLLVLLVCGGVGE